VKIKWADFQQATRSRSVSGLVGSLETLTAISRDLVRSVYPPRMGIRLVGVTLSNLDVGAAAFGPELEPELALG
jgi:DNA polymerase-4